MYSPALTDFVVMVEGTSHMFITGPDVIKTVTGEDVTFEELGGAHAHASKSGVAHYQADRRAGLPSTYARDLLSYLPSNNLEEPPLVATATSAGVTAQDEALDTLIPDSANQPYDMHAVIETVLDDGTFLEVHEAFAPNIIVGFGRVEGAPVGVVANQPMQFAGTPRHRRLGEGGPVRADLRRVLRPHRDLRRRARASCPASPRSGAASSGAAPSCCTPTPRRPSPSSPSSPARPTAARTTSWGPSTSAATSTWPGPPRRSP